MPSARETPASLRSRYSSRSAGVAGFVRRGVWCGVETGVGSELVMAGSRGVDVLVVGGGAAGCVVAARLTQSGSRSVLLLEAGPDRRADTPEQIRDGWQITRDFDWGYVSEPTRAARSRTFGETSWWAARRG